MEKKPKAFSKRIEGICLKRSDLREIANIWSPRAPEETLEFETESHKFADVEELVASRAPIVSLTIRRRRPLTIAAAHIWLDARSVSIKIEDASDADIGIGSQLYEFLLPRRRTLNLSFSTVAAALILGFLLFAACISLRNLLATYPTLLITMLGCVMLLLFGGIGVALLLWIRGDTIRFRAEDGVTKPINWRGAIWQLFLVLFGAAVGCLLTRWSKG